MSSQDSPHVNSNMKKKASRQDASAGGRRRCSEDGRRVPHGHSGTGSEHVEALSQGDSLGRAGGDELKKIVQTRVAENKEWD